MPPGLPPATAHVSYSRQYRRCGKADCARCASGGPGHGPYWYAYWREGGRMRSRYLGKDAPAELSSVPAPPEERVPHLTATGPPVRALARAPAPLRVRTLGAFVVWQGDQRIPATRWTRRDVRALFTLLLGAPGYRLHREQACDALWPEVDPAAAARRLHATLHLLRVALDVAGAPRSHVRLIDDVLALELDAVVQPATAWLDAAVFDQAAAVALAGRDPTACRAALEHYGGDYLPDEPYAEWVVRRREALHARRQALLLHLARLSGAVGDLEEAEQCLRAVLASDACHEDAAATLMGLLAAAGQRSAALRVYQALATALETDLELAPGDAIEALRARLLAQEAAPRAADRVPSASHRTEPTNLPVAATRFVGRLWEQREVAEVLSTTRLLTLTGPGGCGKTRLALEVAGAAGGAYPDGIWLVELAGLGDATLVARAVADALGVRERPGQDLSATVCDFLEPRQVVLVLDTCEHLRDGCGALAALLLQRCVGVRLLATSRHVLGIAGETVWRVAGLAVPDAGVAADPADPADLLRFDAVRLLVERGQAVRPTFVLTERNAPAVLRICRRLDGLPLALELAAARLGHLRVEDVAARLDDRFALLTGGSQTSLPRQQTLRATMEWSYGLLTVAEQAVLRRLAVFAGGCTLEAAAAVCVGAGVDDAGDVGVVDLLARLIDKSLLALEERDDMGRYRLLETVRQYGREQLEAAGEAAEARERHLDWSLTLAEAAEQALTGPDQVQWLTRLEGDHDNLRAALTWTRETGQHARGLRLAAALWRFWYTRGYLSEGRQWLDALLTLTRQNGDVGAATVRATALNAAGVLARGQGDYAPAVALSTASLQLCRDEGNTQGSANALANLGNVACDQGGYKQAIVLFEESLALRRDSADAWGTANALNALGIIALDQGDYERAEALLSDSLALKRACGDTQGIATALTNLGGVALDVGDDPRAVVLLEESVALKQELGDPWSLAISVMNLAHVARKQRAWEQAITLYRRSLALYWGVGHKVGVAMALEYLAGCSCMRGQPRRAGRLLGAAATLRTAIGVPILLPDRADHERALAVTRGALGNDAFAAAWTGGQALALERVMAEALADIAEPATAPIPPCS